MVWIATENFDSYSTGASLNGDAGGSGWTGNWSVAVTPVTSEVAPSGMSGKSALAAWSSGDGGEASRSLTALSVGTVSFQMSAGQTNKAGRFTLGDSSVPISRIIIRFDSDGNIKAVGSGTTTLQAYTTNTVYTFLVKFGHTSGNFAVAINGGAFSADLDCAGTGSQVDSVFLSNENTAASTFYFDDIKDGAGQSIINHNNLLLMGVG